MRYPKEQMHRIAYTKLTEEQIRDRLGAAMAGPSSASELSDALSGSSLKIVTDGGPTLEYEFAGRDRLTIAENGGGAAEVGYGALTLGPVVFFSHMIPGSQRGYNVFVDQDTGLVTVFEVWFSGFDDLYSDQPWFTPGSNNREVQREVYFGYVEKAGQEPPQARHARTNRLAGKAYHWTQDTGARTLEHYPSTFYSNFVELTRLAGELSFCAPSDYVRISEELYIYSRTECEFSGTFTAYVLDVNTFEQIGARLGFTENDDLEYYVFRGHGEWLGQIAHFERFGDVVGAAVMPPPADGSPLAKGARRVYRPLRTFQILPDKAAVDAAVAANPPRVFPEATSVGMAGNKGPVSGFLAGKELTMRWDDGSAIEYRFDEIQTLRWRPEGEDRWREERYESWESAPGVVMFAHLMTGAPNHDAQIVVADFDHGLATLLHGSIGTPYIANEAAVKTVFGVVEMEGITPPKYRRHQFTNEMVGRSITWNYSTESGLTAQHLYSTPHSLSWIIMTENSGGMEWSGPASYVKIREGIYLVYFLEEACNGTLGTLLINLHTMHDCGAGLNCGPNGLSLSSIGAHGRHAGRFDTARFFEIKA